MKKDDRFRADVLVVLTAITKNGAHCGGVMLMLPGAGNATQSQCSDNIF
jgi:hypothetical protein